MYILVLGAPLLMFEWVWVGLGWRWPTVHLGVAHFAGQLHEAAAVGAKQCEPCSCTLGCKSCSSPPFLLDGCLLLN